MTAVVLFGLLDGAARAAAQNSAQAVVLGFLGTLVTSLVGYLGYLKIRATAELKRAEAEAIRAAASTEWQRSLQARVDALEFARETDRKRAAEWMAVALQAKRELDDTARKLGLADIAIREQREAFEASERRARALLQELEEAIRGGGDTQGGRAANRLGADSGGAREPDRRGDEGGGHPGRALWGQVPQKTVQDRRDRGARERPGARDQALDPQRRGASAESVEERRDGDAWSGKARARKDEGT
jgi:hypothetical protein